MRRPSRRSTAGSRSRSSATTSALRTSATIALAARFTKDTGIKVKVIAHPAASTDSYAQLARLFSSKSSSVDVMMLDVVWPGAFAPFLVNLRPALSKEAKLHSQGIIRGATFAGKLVAMPYFGDYGILYYRTDLLKKYGYSKPPTTWAQLGAMAKKIQAGESASNPDFAGFVFQGERVRGAHLRRARVGGVEWRRPLHRRQGKATIDNPRAAADPEHRPRLGGQRRPRGVTSYQETESHEAFAAGNAAFMRNWPYAYSVSQDGAVKGKFDVGGAAAHGREPVGRHCRWLAARDLEVLEEDPGRHRVRPLHDEPGARSSWRSTAPTRRRSRGRQGSGGPEGKPVAQAAIANVARVTRPTQLGRSTSRVRRRSIRASTRS